MKRFLRDYAFLIITALIIVALDQWTKTLVRQNLEYAEMWIPFGLDWLFPYVYVVHWYNTGAAFGIFQEGSMVFTVLAIVISLVILYYYPKISGEGWTMRLALALQLGGAVGNLIDRLTIGHVTDFIEVGSFPVFNVADASITLGVFVLLISMWRSEKEKEKEALTEQPEDE